MGYSGNSVSKSKKSVNLLVIAMSKIVMEQSNP